MKKKEIIKVKINHSKISNKMHLDAQIMYPTIVQKDKTKYDRNTVKEKMKSEMKQYF